MFLSPTFFPLLTSLGISCIIDSYIAHSCFQILKPSQLVASQISQHGFFCMRKIEGVHWYCLYLLKTSQFKKRRWGYFQGLVYMQSRGYGLLEMIWLYNVMPTSVSIVYMQSRGYGTWSASNRLLGIIWLYSVMPTSVSIIDLVA